MSSFKIFLCLTTIFSVFAIEREDARFSFALDAGLPQLIGLEVGLIPIKYFEIGVSYGSLPINNYVQKKIAIDPVAINESYSVQPVTSFKLTAPSFYLRYFPSGNGAYFQVSYSKWKIGTTLSGSLTDSSGEILMSNAITGDVDIDFPNWGLILGYQGYITNDFFLNGGFGLALMQEPKVSISVGGQFSSVAPFLDDAQTAAYESAKTDVKHKLLDELNNYLKDVPVVPLIFVSFGRTF